MWLYIPKGEQSIRLFLWTTRPNTLSDNNVFVEFVFLPCFVFPLAIIPFLAHVPWGLCFPTLHYGLTVWLSSLSFSSVEGGLPPFWKPKILSRLPAPFLSGKLLCRSISSPGIKIPKFGVSVYNYDLAIISRSTFKLLIHVELAHSTEIHLRGKTLHRTHTLDAVLSVLQEVKSVTQEFIIYIAT